MDKETAEALEGSINKWERIVEGSGTDKGMTNCPLCHLFVKPKSRKLSCEGCPVKERSGASFCFNTPYIDFRRYSDETFQSMGIFNIQYARIFDQESKRLATVELEFLKSLREE